MMERICEIGVFKSGVEERGRDGWCDGDDRMMNVEQ